MLLIKNGRIFTMQEENDFNGYVLCKDGKILDVGRMEDLDVEGKTFDRVIDAAGGVVTPGLIDPHCHVGMWENGIGFEGADGNEMTDPVTPHMRATDGIYYKDKSFEEARNAGVTTVVTGPGSANIIGGQFVAMKTVGDRIEDMVIKDPSAMKMAFGENPKRVYHEQKKTPSTRMATAAGLRQALTEAKKYMEKKDEDKYDYKKEELSKVFNGLMVKMHAHREDDIQTAIRIAREYDLDFTVDHCTEGYLIKDFLAANKIKVIVGPLLSDRSKYELKNMSIKNPGLLQKAGVKVAIMTDHPVIPIQYLPLCAGVAVKEGMDMMEALRAITLYAAQLNGIDHRVGSLEKGKDADIAVFDGNPLEVMTQVKATVIDGTVVYEG
ncbi:MAG: amidohydrolase [Clostridia bacterium]